MKRFTKIIVTKTLVFLLLFFAMSAAATVSYAQDFGVVLNQNAETVSFKDMANNTAYAASLIPWFAAPLGENVDLYLSGGLSAQYASGKWGFLPEVYRFEAIFNLSPDLRLQAGRVYFQESLGWVMTGLFDGVSATATVSGGQLQAGVFYTGLLYKEATNICISPQDRADYLDDKIYFASRRLAAGITWEKAGIFDRNADISLSALFQFDLNDMSESDDVLIHSQYLAAKLTLPLGESFNTGFGAAFEAMEETDRPFNIAFALSADLQWLHRIGGNGEITGLFTFGGRFASGAWNDTFGAFSPVSGEAQGSVLRPLLFGIALVQAGYTIRPTRSFFAELSAAYLFRTDASSFKSEELDEESRSPLLGGECFLNLSWKPFSDLLFSLGGGAFFPQLGDAFADDTEVKYRLVVTASIAF